MTKDGFSPILYGTGLIGLAMAAGIYVQSSTSMHRVIGQSLILSHQSEGMEAPLMVTMVPTDRNMSDGGAPGALAREADLCRGPDPALGCYAPDLLQPRVQNVIVSAD